MRNATLSLTAALLIVAALGSSHHHHQRRHHQGLRQHSAYNSRLDVDVLSNHRDDARGRHHGGRRHHYHQHNHQPPHRRKHDNNVHGPDLQIWNSVMIDETPLPDPPWPVKREAEVAGDLIIGGLMMVHEREDSITCGPVMPQGGIQAVETMLYTLDIINRRFGYFKVGAHILDDCDKDTYGLEMAVDFIKEGKEGTNDGLYYPSGFQAYLFVQMNACQLRLRRCSVRIGKSDQVQQGNYMRSVIREISKASNLNDLETLNSDSSFVIFNEVNNRGLITLNRQEKANALNLEMVAAIKRQIKNWKNKVDMIIIRGHDRVFSAGGDLVHFNTNLHKAYEFGKIAYSLDYDISTLHIPYVAIIPGAAFGNGVGLGAFGSALIATETTVLGMPETQLGFFTDAGMTYVFSRMPGGLGMYLALTGYSLKGVDSVKAGLASHFVKNSILPELTESLLNGKIDSRNIQRDLLNYTTNVDLETFSLDCFRRDIDRIFTLPRIEDMVMELEKCNTEWSVKTLETLQKMSPTCLKMTARMLREAKDKTLKECLQRELQMNWVITHSSPSRDFREGINAKLIRKDQNPKWNPGTIVEVTDEMMDELFNTQLPSSEGSISNIDDGEYHCNKTQIRKVISGVVGAASSVTSIQVANLLRLFKIPQVSFFSTSPELSNKQRFEYFTRTIPSDHHQVKAMVEIVRRLGWSYVSIIYEESNYGIKAFEELEALLAKHDICIAIKEKLVKDSGVAEEIAYDNTVLKLLTKPRAKGCIIFGSDQEVAGVMRAVRRCNATGLFSWIGSDGWSARDLVSLGNEPEVEGTLSVQPQANPVLGFEEYFLNLTVENNRRNPWFVEFWEDHFQCKYPNSSRTPYNKKYTRQCSRQERLTRENTAFENQLQFVSDAVMALAIALQDMHRELCPGAKGMCERMIPTKGHDLLKYLRSVNFEGLSGDKFKFDSNGDGPARYNIIHFKKISKNIYQWVKVGEYLEGSLRLNMTDIQFKMGGQRPPESVCSLPCEVGQAKKYVEGESCCWHCFNCTQYQIRNPADETQCLLCPLGTIPVRDKNVCLEIPEAFLRVESAWAISAMIISTSGIIVTLFVAGVFMRHNETPVVKAAGRELSYVLLTGILLCYLITFILVLKPSSFVCGLQRFGAGFCFTVVYAALLTKTNRIARIFNAGKRTAKRPSFINPRSQLLICSALASVQVIINIVWMIVSPPKAIHHYPTREDNLLVCSTFVDASYMIAFGYPIFLIVVCTIYAILTRNIPEAFNESKHIVFTMYTTCVIWLAFVPLYFVTGNHMPLRITSMSVAISLSACVTIGCLFSPKLYIILIRPERNVRQSMMPTTRYSGTVKSGTSASVMAAAVAVTDTPQRLSHTFVRAVDATGREFELKCEGIAIRAKTQFVSRATQTVTTTLPDNNNSQTTEAGSTAILSAPIVVDSPPTVGHASGDAQSTVLGNGPVSNDVQL